MTRPGKTLVGSIAGICRHRAAAVALVLTSFFAGFTSGPSGRLGGAVALGQGPRFVDISFDRPFRGPNGVVYSPVTGRGDLLIGSDGSFLQLSRVSRNLSYYPPTASSLRSPALTVSAGNIVGATRDGRLRVALGPCAPTSLGGRQNYAQGTSSDYGASTGGADLNPTYHEMIGISICPTRLLSRRAPGTRQPPDPNNPFLQPGRTGQPTAGPGTNFGSQGNTLGGASPSTGTGGGPLQGASPSMGTGSGPLQGASPSTGTGHGPLQGASPSRGGSSQ